MRLKKGPSFSVEIIWFQIAIGGCLFEQLLSSHYYVIRVVKSALIEDNWILFACILFWSSFLLFMTFRLRDLPLIGFLFIGIFMFCIGLAESSGSVNAMYPY